MEVSWMHRGRRRGTVVGVLLVALPRRFRGRFLTIKRRFVETVVALSWRGSVVDGVVALLWACCWSPCHDGFVETAVAMSWRGSVVDALWMMFWHRPGRVAGCPATTVLWKPSWYPNVHNRGHCRWTVVGGHAIFPNARGQQAHSCRRPCNFVSPRPHTPSFPAKQTKKYMLQKNAAVHSKQSPQHRFRLLAPHYRNASLTTTSYY